MQKTLLCPLCMYVRAMLLSLSLSLFFFFFGKRAAVGARRAAAAARRAAAAFLFAAGRRRAVGGRTKAVFSRNNACGGRCGGFSRRHLFMRVFARFEAFSVIFCIVSWLFLSFFRAFFRYGALF